MNQIPNKINLPWCVTNNPEINLPRCVTNNPEINLPWCVTNNPEINLPRCVTNDPEIIFPWCVKSFFLVWMCHPDDAEMFILTNEIENSRSVLSPVYNGIHCIIWNPNCHLEPWNVSNHQICEPFHPYYITWLYHSVS